MAQPIEYIVRLSPDFQTSAVDNPDWESSPAAPDTVTIDLPTAVIAVVGHAIANPLSVYLDLPVAEMEFAAQPLLIDLGFADPPRVAEVRVEIDDVELAAKTIMVRQGLDRVEGVQITLPFSPGMVDALSACTDGVIKVYAAAALISETVLTKIALDEGPRNKTISIYGRGAVFTLTDQSALHTEKAQSVRYRQHRVEAKYSPAAIVQPGSNVVVRDNEIFNFRSVEHRFAESETSTVIRS
ncbi:MAG: hypothetical protein KAT62_00790 [Desulfuromonadales bacterium]|nr:hypothetical protein [Desulfuromonadales bacterium]